MQYTYRVTIPLVQNLQLTSRQKFRFGLACSGLARPKRNFCFEVNGRFGTTRCVTLYKFSFRPEFCNLKLSEVRLYFLFISNLNHPVRDFVLQAVLRPLSLVHQPAVLEDNSVDCV